VISHVVSDSDGRAEATQAAAALYDAAAGPFVARSTNEVADLFASFEIVPPGLAALTYQGAATVVLGGIGRLGG